MNRVWYRKFELERARARFELAVGLMTRTNKGNKRIVAFAFGTPRLLRAARRGVLWSKKEACALKGKVIVVISTHHLYAMARYCVHKNKGLVPWIQVGNEHVGIVGVAYLRWQ